MVYPFGEEEYKRSIAALKNNKAAGIDDVLVEQLKNLGLKTHKCLLVMLNNCFTQNLTTYYKINSMRANPLKTQFTAFQLSNKEENRSLKVVRNETELENTAYPKYRGVTLKGSHCYKQHIQNTKMKVATSNNILTKLAISKWDKLNYYQNDSFSFEILYG